MLLFWQTHGIPIVFYLYTLAGDTCGDTECLAALLRRINGLEMLLQSVRRNCSSVSNTNRTVFTSTPVCQLNSTSNQPYYDLGSVTTPSYSLDLIYSSVRRKCFLGFSRLAAFGSWPVCKFEWMSSIRPFRYFVVTYKSLQRSACSRCRVMCPVEILDLSELTASFCWSK
jgi:hypothetical protein